MASRLKYRRESVRKMPPRFPQRDPFDWANAALAGVAVAAGAVLIAGVVFFDALVKAIKLGGAP